MTQVRASFWNFKFIYLEWKIVHLQMLPNWKATSYRRTLFSNQSSLLLDSRQSIYSQGSSTEEQPAKPNLTYTPNHTDQANNSQSSTDFAKSVQSTLKRKLLESTSPQRNKLANSMAKASSGSDDENRGDPDENANGIDLRIGHSAGKNSKKR